MNEALVFSGGVFNSTLATLRAGFGAAAGVAAAFFPDSPQRVTSLTFSQIKGKVLLVIPLL